MLHPARSKSYIYIVQARKYFSLTRWVFLGFGWLIGWFGFFFYKQDMKLWLLAEAIAVSLFFVAGCGIALRCFSVCFVKFL